jgi:hypothetical protein
MVAKQRHGPTDTIELDFDHALILFGNRARDSALSPPADTVPF